MDKREYETWVKHALATFPAIHRVLDGTPEARERSKRWLSALDGIKLVHALSAIDAMLKGEIESPRYDWSELPAYVIRYCIEKCNAEAIQERRSYYGESTEGAVRCLLCGDSQSGFVTIWNPSFIEACDSEILAAQSVYEVVKLFNAWRNDKPQSRHYMTFVVVCCCESPNAKSKRDKGARRVLDAKRNRVLSSLASLQEYLQDSSRYQMQF